LPVVAKAAITTRWLSHASFDHEAHQMVSCAACHAKAADSKETSDVLIPSVQTCKQCHHAGSDAAEARCFECHTYHDWSKEKHVTGAFTVPQLIESRNWYLGVQSLIKAIIYLTDHTKRRIIV